MLVTFKKKTCRMRALYGVFIKLSVGWLRAGNRVKFRKETL
jgi:hypothetical protein